MPPFQKKISPVDPIAAKGVDNIIPSDILSKAQGLAIFTVVKAGFLFSGRAGSGIVVARLEDGSWSAPSAIGTGGMGFGGQIGAEITDFVVVLNNHMAVKSFASGGNVTLGGNLSGKGFYLLVITVKISISGHVNFIVFILFYLNRH